MIYDESQFMKAVLTCLFLLTVQSYDLIWHPHSGQELRYDLKIKADIGGKPFEFRSEVELKVKSVSPNGDYELGTQFKNGVTSFDGQEEKVEEEAEDVQRYNRRGEPLDASEDVEDATSELLGQVSDFVPPDKPVRMYQNWTKEIPARKGLELPAPTPWLPPPRRTGATYFGWTIAMPRNRVQILSGPRGHFCWLRKTTPSSPWRQRSRTSPRGKERRPQRPHFRWSKRKARSSFSWEDFREV